VTISKRGSLEAYDELCRIAALDRFLIELFDVIDDDGTGFIAEDTLGYALERSGVTVDPKTLDLMIQVCCALSAI
jgi:Ca2+-binding EF-hand superfamily protein